MMSRERGSSLIEVTFSSLIAVVIVLAVGSTTDRTQKKVLSETGRIEMQQKARAILDVVSVHARAAGADRNGIFATGSYTTGSVIPVPQATSTLVRLRSDYDDDGALSTSFPEDFTVSWASASKTLTAGPATFSSVSNFVMRYYDSSGTELNPGGGWNIASNASDGTTLRSIARIQFEIQLEGRHRNPETNQYAQQTFIWDVALRNQLTTL